MFMIGKVFEPLLCHCISVNNKKVVNDFFLLSSLKIFLHSSYASK